MAPGGTHRNLHSVASTVQWDRRLTELDQLLLCDAQTSGGLLISVSMDKQDRLISELKKEGVPDPRVVGRITQESEGKIEALP